MTRLSAVAIALGLYTAQLAGCDVDSDIPPVPPIPTPSNPAPPLAMSSTDGNDPPTPPRWVPPPGTTWQWQLTTPIDTSADVGVYDIDGTENGAEVVGALHAAGRKVICYVNVGAAENFRPDYAAFPPSLLGESDGWRGERWLDIRQRDALRPIIAARFDTCAQKGFDAVEADLADGYTSDTGFPLTAQDQLSYNRMVAELAHQRNMSIGLKNDLSQVDELIGDFDFAINEQCTEFHECDSLRPFIEAGKAVFHVEYNLPNEIFCPTARAERFSSMRKNEDLDAPRWPC